MFIWVNDFLKSILGLTIIEFSLLGIFIMFIILFVYLKGGKKK